LRLTRIGFYPTDDEGLVIDERELGKLESIDPAPLGQIAQENAVALRDHAPAGDHFRARAARVAQPIAHGADGRGHLVAVRANVLAGDIGAKLLIAIAIAVENQAGFLP